MYGHKLNVLFIANIRSTPGDDNFILIFSLNIKVILWLFSLSKIKIFGIILFAAKTIFISLLILILMSTQKVNKIIESQQN